MKTDAEMVEIMMIEEEVVVMTIVEMREAIVIKPSYTCTYERIKTYVLVRMSQRKLLISCKLYTR